jgi:hypothetical protein
VMAEPMLSCRSANPATSTPSSYVQNFFYQAIRLPTESWPARFTEERIQEGQRRVGDASDSSLRLTTHA